MSLKDNSPQGDVDQSGLKRIIDNYFEKIPEILIRQRQTETMACFFISRLGIIESRYLSGETIQLDPSIQEGQEVIRLFFADNRASSENKVLREAFELAEAQPETWNMVQEMMPKRLREGVVLEPKVLSHEQYRVIWIPLWIKTKLERFLLILNFSSTSYDLVRLLRQTVTDLKLLPASSPSAPDVLSPPEDPATELLPASMIDSHDHLLVWVSEQLLELVKAPSNESRNKLTSLVAALSERLGAIRNQGLEKNPPGWEPWVWGAFLSISSIPTASWTQLRKKLKLLSILSKYQQLSNKIKKD